MSPLVKPLVDKASWFFRTLPGALPMCHSCRDELNSGRGGLICTAPRRA
jgi:hypothetical protein